MTFTPVQFFKALETTTLCIKILDAEGVRIATVTASEARHLAARGVYKANGTARRVKQMRESGPCAKPRLFPVDLNYQDGRAVIKYHADMRSKGGHQVAA